MMTAGMPAAKVEDRRAILRRIAATVRPDRLWIVTVLVSALIAAFLNGYGPKLLGHATDVVVEGLGDAPLDTDRLRDKLLLAMGAYVVSAVLVASQGRILALIVQRAMQRLRRQVEDKLHRLPLAYLDRQPRGDVLSRVTNDIDNLSQSLQQSSSMLLTSLLNITFVVVLMFTISPLLAVVAVITIPTSVLLVRGITRRSARFFGQQWAHTGALNAQVEEDFTGLALVKVYGRQASAESTFAQRNHQLYEAGFGAQFMAGIVQPLMFLLGNLNFVVIAVVGGLRVSSGAMTLGEVQAFIQYTRQFTQPLTMVASMLNVLQSGLASAERVYALLDAPEESPEPEHGPAPSPARGRVAFEDVTFSYRPDRPLIDGLSLVAEPGQTVAIVGPTGAGKTTLVNLLMRFYELTGGRITLDGVDIAAMDRAALRSHMGMVLQDTWLFEGSIWDNIRYGNLSATDDEVLAAARATYVDRFVRSLPDGYDTVLGDDDTSVSAGEKQLLTIARAFLAQPTILILDEATSSVDTRTEVLLQKAMTALRSNRTSFVIAHRLSTIRDADLILVMDAGAIVEQGDHDALLAADGVYAQLYRAQFAGPLTEDPAAPPQVDGAAGAPGAAG